MASSNARSVQRKSRSLQRAEWRGGRTCAARACEHCKRSKAATIHPPHHWLQRMAPPHFSSTERSGARCSTEWPGLASSPFALPARCAAPSPKRPPLRSSTPSRALRSRLEPGLPGSDELANGSTHGTGRSECRGRRRRTTHSPALFRSNLLQASVHKSDLFSRAAVLYGGSALRLIRESSGRICFMQMRDRWSRLSHD